MLDYYLLFFSSSDADVVELLDSDADEPLDSNNNNILKSTTAMTSSSSSEATR